MDNTAGFFAQTTVHYGVKRRSDLWFSTFNPGVLMPVVRGASLILFAVVIVNFVCSLGIQGIDNSLSGLQSVKNRLEDRNTDLLVEQVVLNFKPSIERLAFQQLGLVNGIERGQVVRFNRKTGRFEPVPESGQVARLDRKKGPFEPI